MTTISNPFVLRERIGLVNADSVAISVAAFSLVRLKHKKPETESVKENES